MSSKREEEKIEKIIRGLMKLPPNRKCINCNSLGPQYVCTNFWTFVCTACSGIHREFTHRVKSVSMAKFTTQEVEALQKGGNQIAREIFLKDWDMQRMRFPSNSNPDKIREFIKDVYVNKKYAESRHSGKPPRDVESFKDSGLEQRRASSYHSFSQSPPYEYQYEDRRYGKQFGMLNRKSGLDRGPYDGKMNSFMYSPGHLHMQTYEDKFANESSGSRMSDFSVSSAGDTFRFDGQSLNSQSSSPSLYHGSDIITEDGRPQGFNRLAEANARDQIPGPKRILSAGTLASASVGEFALEPVHTSGIQHAKSSTFSSTQPSASACPGNKNPSNSTFVQEPMVSSQSVDLFADFSNQPSSLGQVENKPGSGSVSHISLDLMGISDIPLGHVHLSGQKQPNTSTFPSTPNNTGKNDTFGPGWVQPSKTSSVLFDNFNNQFSSTISTENKPDTVPIPQNEGWATFDLPHPVVVDSTLNPGISSLGLSGSGVANANVSGLASVQHSTDQFPVLNPTAPEPLPMKFSQWHLGPQEPTESTEQKNLQLWNAFDGSAEKVDETSVGGVPQSRAWLPAPDSLFHDSNITLKVLEEFDKDWPFTSVAEAPYFSSLNPMGGVPKQQKSTNPFDLPYDAHLEPMSTLDIGSFGAALPSSQLTEDYLASISQPWIPQNASVTHLSPLPEGGLQYMPGQGPSTPFPSFPSQGPGASVGGNPFA